MFIKAWLPVVGHHCQQKLAVCLGVGADRLFAFASVSPDGFRQGFLLHMPQGTALPGNRGLQPRHGGAIRSFLTRLGRSLRLESRSPRATQLRRADGPYFSFCRRIEAYSLDTAVPSGGQALADRLRFSSLCSECGPEQI